MNDGESIMAGDQAPVGGLEVASGTASGSVFHFDAAAVDAEDLDLVQTGLSLASLAHLTYEGDLAAVREQIERAGLRLVTGFLNPFGKKGAQGFAVETGRSVIVAFRGSDEPLDWLRNLRLTPTRWWGIYPAPVHKGFAVTLAMVWKKALAKVLERAQEKPVLFAGHSLGGALAMLAASRFEEATVKAIHTFGQPLTGTPPFCGTFDPRFQGKYVRWVNDQDVVARIPPEPLYRHAGILKHFSATGELLGAGQTGGRKLRPLSREEFRAFQEQLRVSRDLRKSGAHTPPPGVADHSLANGYLPKLRRLAGVSQRC